MFRQVKDPTVSVAFYRDHFSFQLLHEMHFNEWEFSLYFMGILPADEAAAWPTPGTPEAGKALWNSRNLVTLELTHNHGTRIATITGVFCVCAEILQVAACMLTLINKRASHLVVAPPCAGTEKDASHKTNNGNDGPDRGFAHCGVATDDAPALAAALAAAGVRLFTSDAEPFQCGRQFAQDPDGYWIELMSSPSAPAGTGTRCSLATTAMRVRDPARSLAFYQGLCGMSLVAHQRHAAHATFELAQLPPGTALPDPAADPAAGRQLAVARRATRLELIHAFGTESLEKSPYHSGNEDENGKIRGWGHSCVAHLIRPPSS